jgi:hypothetical protein
MTKTHCLRIFLIGFLFLCFVTVGGNRVSGEEKASAPVIELDSTTYEFGKVNEGQVITHDFKVFNRGNAVLEIRQVKPG